MVVDEVWKGQRRGRGRDRKGGRARALLNGEALSNLTKSSFY